MAIVTYFLLLKEPNVSLEISYRSHCQEFIMANYLEMDMLCKQSLVQNDDVLLLGKCNKETEKKEGS